MNESMKHITGSTHPTPPWEDDSDGFAAKDIFIEKLMNRVAFLEAQLSKGKTKDRPLDSNSN
jgi:hypothetical protein